MVPLLAGPVPLEVVKAENPMKYMVDKVKAKHRSFRVLEGNVNQQIVTGKEPPNTVEIHRIPSQPALILVANAIPKATKERYKNDTTRERATVLDLRAMSCIGHHRAAPPHVMFHEYSNFYRRYILLVESGGYER